MSDRRHPRRGARAFTLVELMIVIVIIATLAGLLLPVVQGAIRKARHSAQSAEFGVLATKLEAFRLKYGAYPPSRIILPEDGAWNVNDSTPIPVAGGGTDITYGQLNQRTVQYLRQFWPGMPISTTATPLFDGTGTWFDFDGDGRFDPPASADVNGDGTPEPAVAGRGRILEGTEALVFWLGGLPLDTGTTGDPEISLSGFARGKYAFPGLSGARPHPFRNAKDDGNRAFGGDRDPLFHEFAVDRLEDGDGDGFPAFVDRLAGKPLAYFRSEGGWGYDPNDVNVPEPDTSGAVNAVLRRFRIGYATAAGAREVLSPGPNPYSTNQANSGSTTAWHKPGSFQILCAGDDGLYGPGGRYVPNGKTPQLQLPLEPTTGTVQNLNTADKDVRGPEFDNLASFASGTLAQ